MYEEAPGFRLGPRDGLRGGMVQALEQVYFVFRTVFLCNTHFHFLALYGGAAPLGSTRGTRPSLTLLLLGSLCCLPRACPLQPTCRSLGGGWLVTGWGDGGDLLVHRREHVHGRRRARTRKDAPGPVMSGTPCVKC